MAGISFRPRLDDKFSKYSNEEINLILEQYDRRRNQTGTNIFSVRKNTIANTGIGNLSAKIDDLINVVALDSSVDNLESLLTTLNAKIDEDSDDNDIAVSGNHPIEIILNYSYDSVNDKWVRSVVNSDTGQATDLLGVGGSLIDSVLSLGGSSAALGVGLVGAAGAFAVIDSNGSLQTELFDESGNSLLTESADSDDQTSKTSQHLVVKSRTEEYDGRTGNYDRVYTSIAKEQAGQTSTGAYTVMSLKTITSKFSLQVVKNVNTGSITSLSVDLELSNNGTDFKAVGSLPLGAGGGHSILFITDKVARHVRINVTSFVKTGDATFDYYLTASAR